MKGQIQNDIIVSYGEVLSGADVFDIPGDYSPERYNYTPSVPGVFDPNGFTLRPQAVVIDEARRRENITEMSEYMAGFIGNGLTQANYELFLSDTATLQQQYISGSGRLITWIETLNRNGYNASNVGFKTRAAYNGVGVAQPGSANNERANFILGILNDL